MRHLRTPTSAQRHDDGTSPRGRPADGPPNATPPVLPDYFGTTPNYANSPLPVLVDGQVQAGTGLRKFIDSLPGLNTPGTLGGTLPVAVPDTVTYPGCDYYELGVQQYTQQLHRDLPATRLRGYRQLNHGTDGSGHNTIAPPNRVWYGGPVIMARRHRPVRVKLVNQLPVGPAGKLFLPVDPTVMGAGVGPLGDTETYTQNRVVMHLHGSDTPWISDGTPQQWFVPATETTSYPRGASYAIVPDMPDPGPGAVTLYYPNQLSARQLWMHDHVMGMTRLSVYSGMIAGYLLTDDVEQQLVADGVIPAEQIPLVIQDKTFVPGTAQLAEQDPTWDTAAWGGLGGMWFPHVYMPNQNPYNESGSNPMGRWDYGPWLSPPADVMHGPVANPNHAPDRPWEPPLQPGTPTPSVVPESFHDTPLVNGAAYPYLAVRPKAYRFRILNSCTERVLNLQLYYAKSNGRMWNPDGTLNDAGAGEVPMVPAGPDPSFPPDWPTDGRAGGVPYPGARGPAMIQIGTEGGVLPAPVLLPNRPISWEYDPDDGSARHATSYALLIGPAERADVIIDFSSVPPGSNLILYNDCGAPLPGFDPRYDYYTGDPDQTGTGGAPTTQPGYGPNTRTIMQFRVSGTPAAPYDLARLRTRLPRAYAASQPRPIVPEQAYDVPFGTTTPTDTYVRARDTTVTFTPHGATGPVTLDLRLKAIAEDVDPDYGRGNAQLGVALPGTCPDTPVTIPLPAMNPPTEVVSMSDPATPVGSPGDGTQLWRVTHRGDDDHFIHFHFCNVQLVNRIDAAGVVRPPDPNELGWKETVRMSRLEDTVVALRPLLPVHLPFRVGDSVRYLDPTQPPGATSGFAQIDPYTGKPAVVRNEIDDFGWEYVWHCHMVGHEDFDMMRPLVLLAAPAAPAGLTATPDPGSITVPPGIALRWTNNAVSPPATAVVIQRSTNAAFTAGLTTFTLPASATTYTDRTVVPDTTYHYRVRAENSAAYSAWSNAETIGRRIPTSRAVA